jgi:hypothetical protein
MSGSTVHRCLDTVRACGFYALADRAEETLREDTARYDEVWLERNALRDELNRVNDALGVLLAQANNRLQRTEEHRR